MGVFKKGEIHNPGGSRKRKLVRDALIKLWHDPVGPKGFMGHPKKQTGGQRMMMILFNAGLRSDIAAINSVMDRVDGKVPLPVGGDIDLPSIQTEDVSMKELARIAAYLLISESKKPEDGVKTQKKRKTP